MRIDISCYAHHTLRRYPPTGDSLGTSTLAKPTATYPHTVKNQSIGELDLLPYAPLEANFEQLLGLHRELHWQFVHYLFHVTVHDKPDGLLFV